MSLFFMCQRKRAFEADGCPCSVGEILVMIRKMAPTAVILPSLERFIGQGQHNEASDRCEVIIQGLKKLTNSRLEETDGVRSRDDFKVYRN